MTIANLLQALRRYIVLFVTTTLICALLAIGYAKLSPSSARYSATATAYLEITTADNWNPENQKDVTPLSYTAQRNNTIQPLFTSYETVQQGLTNLGLDDDVENVQKNISLKTNIEQLTTEVTVEMDTPDDAKNLANELVALVAQEVEEIEGADSPYKVKVLIPATETGTISGGISAKKMGLVGIAGGLFLGLALSLVLWLSDKRIRTVSDLAHTLSVPVLASFPVKADLENDDATRRLRATIIKLEERTPVILTSARDTEETSPLSIALAHSLANTQHDVLLVDANPQAVTSTALGVQSEQGLSDVLSGSLSVPEVTVMKDDVRILPAGTDSVALVDLLARDDTAKTMSNVETDNVLLDTAGVLDSSTLAALSEIPNAHAILLIYANKTTFSDAQRAAELLDDAGVQILGTVFMGLDTSWYARLRYGNPEIAEHITRGSLEN